MDKNSFSMPPARPLDVYKANLEEFVLQPFEVSPGANFGCGGAQRTYNQIFDDSASNNVVWQADVYHHAAQLIDAIGAERVVDLGCGNGLKLRAITEGRACEVVVVDYHASLASARQNVDADHFIDCNLSDWHEADNVAQFLRSPSKTVIIISDVIEHILDPRPVLRLIRSLLADNPDNRVVLSTPDRSRLGYADGNGIPENPSHVREWTLLELCGLLKAAGLSIVSSGHVHPNQYDPVASTSVVEARYDRQEHVRILETFGIRVDEAPIHLFITTEYPGLNSSGGIGAFVANQRKLMPNSIVLLASEPTRDIRHVDAANVLWPSRIIAPGDGTPAPREDGLLACLFHLMFLTSDIRWVHYQDYGGIGVRISQAKRSGLLPETLTSIVHCHGNTFYLENANEKWSVPTSEHVAEKEKISIESADFAVFPTRFLKDLYKETGIEPDESRVLLEPYCYDLSLASRNARQKISRIVFVGKRSHMKGFDLFVDAFKGDTALRLRDSGVTEVVFVGPTMEDHVDVDLGHIAEHFKISEYKKFDWQQLCAYIREVAADSVFVLPYRADNFPLAVIDVVANGGLIISAKAGGIPEMFDGDIWSRCLSDVTPVDLGRKMLEFTRLSLSEADFLIDSPTRELSARRARSPAYASIYAARQESGPYEGKATVLIPFFNTDLDYVSDLIDALNCQSTKPYEVIVVDDASRPELARGIAELCEKQLELPFRIVRHEVNKGLAGARNTALHECRTEYLLNLDSDDVPLNEWVRDIVRALNRDPGAVAAVPYLTAFHDGDKYRVNGILADYTYRPLGDGAIAAQTDNILGHANSGVRVGLARELGGWGEHTKAKFEDWAFYLAAVSRRHRIAIIPRTSCLYRVRVSSMVRTYGDWAGFRRIATVTESLSRFESVALQRQLRLLLSLKNKPESINSSLQQDYDALVSEVHRLRSRRVVRLADGAKAQLQRWPPLWRVTAAAYQGLWACGSAIRRRFR